MCLPGRPKPQCLHSLKFFHTWWIITDAHKLDINNKKKVLDDTRYYYKFVFTVLSGCKKKINKKYRTKREQLKCVVLEFLWWRWLIVFFLSGSVAHCFSVLGASYSNYHVGRACVAAFTVLWLTKCLDCWPSTVMQ